MDAKVPIHNKAFSLVELMIVILIIGILAAIAVPIYNNNMKKAKRTEADVALGSIFTQLQIYRSEYGRYPKQRIADYVVGASWNTIKPGELTGKYFSDSSYTYQSPPNGKSYIVKCDKGSVLDFDRLLDHEGIFWDE